MKMMLWKEIRENFKWAILALLVLTLAEFYVLSSTRTGFQDSFQNSTTLCNSSFLLVTAFGSAVIGAFFGAVQILPELRRDRWAALLHRPVSRGVIFFGKVFAGLILSFFATAIPFFASVCYVATPGVFPAPVVPGMLLPGLSDLLLVGVFYFAALLLCLHRGRWFGTRGTILLTAAGVFLFHDSDFGSVILPLVATVVFMLAAWGAMLGTGPIGDQPRPARFSFILIVLLGAQVALGLTALVIEIVPWPWVKAIPPIIYTNFQVTKDGQIFQTTSEGDGENRVVTDMNGKVITDERYVGNDTYDNFYQFQMLGFDLRMPLRGYFSADVSLRSTVRYIQSVRHTYGEKEIWYLLIAQNYFIGYDSLSCRCIGICDRDGFKPPGARPVPFDYPLKGDIYATGKLIFFWSGPKVYSISFPDRTMAPFFIALDDMVYQATSFTFGTRADAPTYALVALENDLRVFDDKGTPILSLPYPHDPGVWSGLSISGNDPLTHLYVQSGPGYGYVQHFGAAPIPSFLDEFDLKGNSLLSYSHLNHDPTYLRPQYSLTDKALGSLLPFGPTLAYISFTRLFSDGPPAVGNTDDKEPVPGTLLDLAILFVIGIALALFSFRWARSAGIPTNRARPWALFVFLFGPAGLLTFRLASDWPVRVKCPQCESPRPVDTNVCPHCAAPWPPPTKSGTEIFDATPAEPTLVG